MRAGRMEWVSSPGRQYWLLLGLLLLGWGLLVSNLTGLSLWTDELYTAQWVTGSVGDLLTATINDVHPPLYFLLLKGWAALAGSGDFSLRFFSVAAGWLSLAFVYRLGRAWGGSRLALVTTTLCALSPLLVLYDRMARYYSTAMLLGLVSTWLLWRLLRRPQDAGWRLWSLYGLASLAAIYTFYLAGLLIVAHGWAVLLLGHRRLRRQWLLTGLLVVLGVAPWAGVVIGQLLRTGRGAADLAFGWLGLASKLGFLAYDLALGETIFPWQPLAVVGVVTVAALWLLSLLRLRRWRNGQVLWLVTLTAVGGGVLLVGLLSPRTPFVSLPARLLFVAPLVYALAAGGLVRLRWREALPALLILLFCSSVSLSNYFHQQQFLNPIYLTPARQMAALVASAWQPGDAVFSPWDSGFDTYYQRQAGPGEHFTDSNAALAAFSARRPQRVWLVTLGRDQSRLWVSDDAQEWLAANGRLVETWHYVPQDPIYRELKSRLLGRPAYAYRASISLYQVEGH